MKKILFTVVATLIISSCPTEKEEITTFIVKFKDGTEMRVIGTDASASRDAFYVYHDRVQTSVFTKDEVLYIVKEFKDKEE